jgi:Co/Zn/Cd efflux system component
LVALYAIKLAGNSKRSHEYSYGWQRAEVLGKQPSYSLDEDEMM